MYLIKTIDENYKLDNSVSHELGYINIFWRNYFGDMGQLKCGPFRSLQASGPSGQDTKTTVDKKEIEVQLLGQGKVSLELERPQKVTFRLHNQTERQMKLQLQINESTQSDIVICGCYP
jgi:hypothetical protein